jgi:hypothetical protein
MFWLLTREETLSFTDVVHGECCVCVFNSICWCCLLSASSRFIIFNLLILDLTTVKISLAYVASFFLKPWKQLCSIRCVKGTQIVCECSKHPVLEESGLNSGSSSKRIRNLCSLK